MLEEKQVQDGKRKIGRDAKTGVFTSVKGADSSKSTRIEQVRLTIQKHRDVFIRLKDK